MGNDGVIGNYLAGAAGEEGDDLEFDLGQVDIFSVQGDEAFFEVDDQPVCPVRPLVQAGTGLEPVAVPEGRADAGHQLGRAERLGNIIVGAAVQGQNFFLFLGTGGNNNNRDAGPGADFADDFDAVPVGKAEIEKDQIRAAGGDEA